MLQFNYKLYGANSTKTLLYAGCGLLTKNSNLSTKQKELKKRRVEINKIYNENCLKTMAKMPDNFIDLTVTSPPYDDLREYKGYCFDFENVAKELYRVTKDG